MVMGENIAVLILCAIIGLVVSYFIANCFYDAATAKGWSSKKYFWICFILPLIGYLLVIALPDRGKNVPSPRIPNAPPAKSYHDELPDL